MIVLEYYMIVDLLKKIRVLYFMKENKDDYFFLKFYLVNKLSVNELISTIKILKYIFKCHKIEAI